MFTPDQTGRPTSPRPDLQKTVCGSCAVCKGHLNASADPKLLPCLHAVCNTCLTNICTDGGTQDCPSCAQSFGLSEVTECVIFQDSSDKNKALKCGGCEENEVSGWCVQCEEALCLDCMSAHRRVKVTRDHEVTPKKPPTGWIHRTRCPLHSQESLRFYCLVCEELTCKDCQLITHRGHSFVQQEEAVESQKQQLQSLLDSIKQQKGTVNSSLLLLEARLKDIENVKILTKKILTQTVCNIYQTMVVKATLILKEIKALFAEEANVLLEKKTSLNRLEGCQDYITAFVDKILSTEGNCLLVYKKRIETQVKKLLSQEIRTPETMIKLHLQLQNDICQHIMNFGFVKITKFFVPFTSDRIASTKTKPVSVESLKPNSVKTATDHVPASSSVNEQVPGECVLNNPAQRPVAPGQNVQTHQILHSLLQPSQSKQTTTQSSSNHAASFQPNLSKVPSTDLQSSFSSSTPSVQVQSHQVMAGQSNHAYRSLSGCVSYSHLSAPKTHSSPPSSVYSQDQLPFSKQTQINDNSNKAKSINTWTLHYNSHMPTQKIPRNNQTPALRSSLPANYQTPVPIQPNNQKPIPARTQTTMVIHSIPANNQTSLPTHPVSANNQTTEAIHPITANNQTTIPSHSKPASNQPSILLPQISANNQTPSMTRAFLVNNQTPILPHKITASDQTLARTQPFPSNNQSHTLTHALQINNQTTLPPQPIPINNQTPILIPPVVVNSQTPVLIHPGSNLPRDIQTLILTHPTQAGFLGSVHGLASQPNVPLTVLSTINTLPLNNVAVLTKVHSTGKSNDGMNHHPRDPCAQNPASPAFNVIPSASSVHANSMHSDPISGSNTLQNSSNIPVKALADSACDQEAGVSSTNFMDTDHSESNLPTSTVSETDPREPSPDFLDLCIAQQDTLSTTTKKYLRQAEAQCNSGSKHWSADMPRTFRQLLETTRTPDSLVDHLNATPPVDSTPCSTSEHPTGETMSRDRVLQTCFDNREGKEKLKESAVMLKHFRTQLNQYNRFLSVSLVRLPISLPPHGHPLPEFHLTTDSSTDQILVQESQGGEIKQVWRWHDGPVLSRDSSCSLSQISDVASSPASDVEFCVVCQSAGAPLLCTKCGNAFHHDCHIPPILTKPCENWVCLLCEDVNETIMFRSDEEMRMTGLSLQDQRRCEKLLLGLLCDENMGLLYSVTKNDSKTAEFDIILGRLQGNKKPPYRTAAELVSDVWTLLDILFINSEKKHTVVELQKSFQQQLNETFGKSLHASLLEHFSSTEQGETSKTEAQNQKHRNTLKRMREFFTANCGIAVKKSCSDKGKETTAAEHC